MDVLGKLFGSPAQVKIMRLFLFHPGVPYESKDVVRLTRVQAKTARRELEAMAKIGLIKKKTFSKEGKTKTKQGKPKKKKVTGWELNESFSYLKPLQNILINSRPLQHKELARRFQNIGSVKLLIITGVFIQQWDSRVDILVVGDKLKDHRVRDVVRVLESEVGTELTYSAFSTGDFHYRLDVYDKLVRDILDYPHERVVDKIGIDNYLSGRR